MPMKILNLKRSLPDNVVLSVEWQLFYTDGGFAESLNGSIDLPFLDSSDPSFVPFESLTEAQVVNWVKAQYGEENVGLWEDELKTKVQLKKNPVVTTGLPWA